MALDARISPRILTDCSTDAILILVLSVKNLSNGQVDPRTTTRFSQRPGNADCYSRAKIRGRKRRDGLPNLGKMVYGHCGRLTYPSVVR